MAQATPTHTTNPSASHPIDLLDRLGDVRLTALGLNGLTIGSAASGATERANADTQALFVFLWNALGNDHPRSQLARQRQLEGGTQR